MNKSTTTVTAADVRAFFQADAKRLAVLSPEARKTVEQGARGRLHAEAVEVHNKRRRTRTYTLGASTVAAEAAKAEAAALRVAAAEAGVTVGKRGPLPKAAKQALAQSKG